MANRPISSVGNSRMVSSNIFWSAEMMPDRRRVYRQVGLDSHAKKCLNRRIEFQKGKTTIRLTPPVPSYLFQAMVISETRRQCLESERRRKDEPVTSLLACWFILAFRSLGIDGWSSLVFIYFWASLRASGGLVPWLDWQGVERGRNIGIARRLILRVWVA